MLCGAKAFEDDNFTLLRYILQEPIEVEDSAGHFSNLPFIRRRDLFWPEGMLGYANQGAIYLATLWEQEEHLKLFFPTLNAYHFELAKFYILVVLGSPIDDSGNSIYPGYVNIPQADRAMSWLHSKLASSLQYQENIAHSIGLTPEEFRSGWIDKARIINGVNVGGWRQVIGRSVRIPETLDM